MRRFACKYPGIGAALRRMFRPCSAYLLEKDKQHRNKVFQKNALATLERFNMTMEKLGVPYTLAFGSILGAIREHGFIKHDLDIDTAVWIEDYTPRIAQELEKAGFVWVFEHTVDGGKLGREDTFEYDGVRIDIFYMYPPINEYPYCCDFVFKDGMEQYQRLARRIEIPFSRQRRKVRFESIELYVPDNAEEYCEFRYGPDYMTPNSSWSWIAERQHVVEWDDKFDVTYNRKYPHANDKN